MNLSRQAREIHDKISREGTKLGDLRKIAKGIKMDHELAMELWSAGNFFARQLAILIMDKKRIDPELIDELIKDMESHDDDEKIQLIDWLMANQLAKDKNAIALMLSWQKSPSTLQRRVFWYYQARLRWMGNTNHTNTENLLKAIETHLMDEQPEVQWAMNYTAGQIGKWQEEYRDRCISIGENTGLFKDEVVPRGCTPSYLPKFIPIEVAKIKK